MQNNFANVRDANLERYIQEINRHRLLSREEEDQLARRYRATGDVAAAHKLVASNLRFVVKVAHGYRGYGMKLSDLIQEGNIGLMMAVRKFDPNRGYRLISYAVWWIRSYINNYIIRSWSLVKLGTTQAQRKLFFKLPPALARTIGGEKDRAEIAQELAEQFGVSREDVGEMEMRLAAKDYSLDAKIRTESTTTHLEQLEEPAANQEDQLADKEALYRLRGELHKALDGLSERERHIITARVMTDEPKTLGKLGRTFNVSRERVRQIEKKALGKLRSTLEQARLDAMGLSSTVQDAPAGAHAA